MNDEHLKEILTYWMQVSECECGSKFPIGGCLRCDMEIALETLKAITNKKQ